jgi:hypothetical protein
VVESLALTVFAEFDTADNSITSLAFVESFHVLNLASFCLLNFSPRFVPLVTCKPKNPKELRPVLIFRSDSGQFLILKARESFIRAA